jgi:hypothetical protein
MDAGLVGNITTVVRSGLGDNITNGIVAASAIVVAVMAFLGVNTWRKEMTGKAKYELARKLMVRAYSVRDKLKKCTFPISGPTEWADRVRITHETVAVSQVLNDWHARAKRVQAVFEELPELDALAWESKAVFDETTSNEVLEAVKMLRSEYGNIASAVQMYFAAKYHHTKSGEGGKLPDDVKRLESVVYWGIRHESDQADIAVEKLSDTLRKYLRG